MKTKVLTGLAIAAALLIGQPIFAHPAARGGGARGGAHVAAVHVSRGPARSFATGRVHSARSEAFATRSRASGLASRNLAVNRSRGSNFAATNNANFARTNSGRHNSVAFGGGSHNNNTNYHGTYAFASHNGWSDNREYFWHGHHYRWYDNGWFIIDPYPYGYGYTYDNSPYYGGGGNVGVQVQAALQQQGYYQGPVDGIVGPGTSQAIANYQQDNGLRVTGTITPGLLNNLGIG